MITRLPFPSNQPWLRSPHTKFCWFPARYDEIAWLEVLGVFGVLITSNREFNGTLRPTFFSGKRTYVHYRVS